MAKHLKTLGLYAILFAVVITTYTTLRQPTADSKIFSEMVNVIESGKVSKLIIEDTKVTAELKDKTTMQVKIPTADALFYFSGDKIKELVKTNQILVDIKPSKQTSIWLNILPYIVMSAFFILLWLFILPGMGGGSKIANVGKSRARMMDSRKKITFNDVAGADEEKLDLMELVEFLRNPQKFTALGARIPKGVLLQGPPGTGKTLLARAVAGEAEAPFYSISGSDFVEMFVGVGASRVRDLFETAKKTSPSVIFIDEIDAVGRHRGAGLGGGNDEREQTLNQLLVEMDGFGTNEGVIVIAATNRPDILDPALLRPGRFDRQITVMLPDVKGREEILKIHAKNKPLAEEVSLNEVARGTAGFTGADLENLLNEAALLAARDDKKAIYNADIQQALMKVVLGTEKKSHAMNERAKKLTAYHEAGHAVVAKFLPTQDPIHEVSIIPRGMAGGYTMHIPKEDQYYVTKTNMIEDIIALLGGQAAEKLILNDISTGASSDIARASDIARKMVTRYGMSEKLGPIAFGTTHDEVFIGKDWTQSRNFSEGVASEIDGEIRTIIGTCFEKCQAILKENQDKLESVAQALLKHEKLTGEMFDKAFELKLEEGI